MLPSARRTEPRRDCRRPFGLSYAAMATSSSMARAAAATSLVPMAALAEPGQALRDSMANVGAEGRAPQQLRDHIHLDLLAYDDWLGSGHAAPRRVWWTARGASDARRGLHSAPPRDR